MYEGLLDVASCHILEEQEKGAVLTEFAVGSFVLVSYLVCPPSKLHCRWGGPSEVLSRIRNNVIVRDLTNDMS